MKLICVDDVARVMNHLATTCLNLPGIDDVQGFTRPPDALEWVKTYPVDVAILDIDMPEMDGLTLAKNIRRYRPNCAIIFMTAFAQFALEAFAVHPSGYLLKPINEEELAREVAYALSRMPGRTREHIEIKTFGNFEILVDGEALHFRRAKSKELLAFLVDQQGNGVTRPEIYAALWEDSEYTQPRQKYLDVIIRSLRDTLAAHGIEDILEMKSGFLRVRPEQFKCDLYAFLQGRPEMKNAYRGKYMSNYPWAVLSEARLTDQWNGQAGKRSE